VEENLAPTVSGMKKRRLRLLRWLGTVPAIGTCTLCNFEFEVPTPAMKDAKAFLRIGNPPIAEYQCNP
jgi:hypothetical protein